MKTSLYFSSGGSDKEYHVQIDNGTVTVQYGRRGSALTQLTKCENLDPVKAEKLYQKIIRDKKGKGYSEGESGTIYSSPVDPNQTGYQPQLLNEIDEPTMRHLLDNDDWLIQEKEDGRNAGLIYRDGKVIAANKKGLAISVPTDIVNPIVDIFKVDFTLCGELVGDVFKAWDIINHPYISHTVPYISRYEFLKTHTDKLGGSNIMLTKTAITTLEKHNLYNELKERNAEGMVFKLKHSLYSPGRPNSGGDQLKFKFTATCSVIVGKKHEEKRSVMMWMFDKGNRIFVGNVTIYPNQEIPKEGSVIEVRYLYAYPNGGSLFQPVYLNPRNDVEQMECTMSQLKYKAGLVTA